MGSNIAQLTKDEIKELIEETVEQKLIELLGDPDEGLELRKSLRERLLRQRKNVLSGKRGVPIEDAIKKLNTR